jgi:hypothetical protein
MTIGTATRTQTPPGMLPSSGPRLRTPTSAPGSVNDVLRPLSQTPVNGAIPCTWSALDLTDYATEAYVDTAIDNIPPVDLSSYLTSATAASTYVPYSGATSNLNLGTHAIAGGKITTSSGILFSPDNTVDLGLVSLAIGRPRDIYAGRNVTAGGTITATGTISGSNLSGTNTGDQDLSSYLTSATAASTYLALAGGTLNGNLFQNNANVYGWSDTRWARVSANVSKFVGSDGTTLGTIQAAALTASSFLVLSGTSGGVTLNASGVEWGRITNTHGPVFRSYVGLGATADSVPDAYFYRFGTGQCGVLANNGFKISNQANTADASLTCGSITASGTLTCGVFTANNSVRLNGGSHVSSTSFHLVSWSGARIGWSNSSSVLTSTAPDQYLLREDSTTIATGLAVGGYANFKAGAITASGLGKFGILTVATLPSAAANPYCEGNVSDALGPVIGSPVVGGGAVKASVRSNGTNWTVTGI